MIRVEEVLDQLDIADVIEYYTGNEVFQSGSRRRARCVNPNHPDRNPSMEVYKDNTCRCYACSQNFGILDIVGFYTSAKTLPEKLKTLIYDFGLTVEDKDFDMGDFPLVYEEMKAIDPEGVLLKRQVENTMFKDTDKTKFEIPRHRTYTDQNGEEHYNKIYIYNYDDDGNDITDYIWSDGFVGKIGAEGHFDDFDMYDEDKKENAPYILASADYFQPSAKAYAKGGLLAPIEIETIIDIWNNDKSADNRLWVCDILEGKIDEQVSKVMEEQTRANKMIGRLLEEDIELSDNLKEKYDYFTDITHQKLNAYEGIRKKLDDTRWRINNPDKVKKVKSHKVKRAKGADNEIIQDR